MSSKKDFNSMFVKPDMRYGCEIESVRIAGIYLRLMLDSDIRDRILTGMISKSQWKKMYISFMRKNNVDCLNNRHAYQVLYALSRHYEVCRVDDKNITWTCQNVHTAHSKYTIGDLKGELHWVYEELRKAENQLAKYKSNRQDEEGEVSTNGVMTMSEIA